MGKGTIVSGGTGGLYTVTVNYDRSAYNAEVSRLASLISGYEARIAVIDDGREKNSLKSLLLAAEKRKAYIEAKMPNDYNISAWCADLTEDLTGEVGLIEVPGEPAAFNIQPGYDSNAAYDAGRDGQLLPSVAMSPSQSYFNTAILPGWQKWKPTFRYGTITSIDFNTNTASVALDPAYSSRQGLDINQALTLEDVLFGYHMGQSVSFVAGDKAIIYFDGQDWGNPRIIGFKDSPIAAWVYIFSEEKLNWGALEFYDGPYGKSITWDYTDTPTGEWPLYSAIYELEDETPGSGGYMVISYHLEAYETSSGRPLVVTFSFEDSGGTKQTYYTISHYPSGAHINRWYRYQIKTRSEDKFFHSVSFRTSLINTGSFSRLTVGYVILTPSWAANDHDIKPYDDFTDLGEDKYYEYYFFGEG